jgi:predicted nucleotidyltransferase
MSEEYEAETTSVQVTENDIQEMVRRIVAAADPVKVILMGSHAWGTAQPDSDVDLLVIEHDPVAQRQEAVRLRRLLRDFQVPIDIVVVGQSFAQRYWDIPGSVLYPAFREGRVLYD